MEVNLREILVAGVDQYGSVVEKPLPEASEKQVVNFERLIGTKLPLDYREFLLTINGGSPNLNKWEGVQYKVTPVTDDPMALSGTNLLEHLYPLGDDGIHAELLGVSIPTLTLIDRFDFFTCLKLDTPFVPAGCMPIGTPYGSQSMLLLCLKGEFENHILDYEHRRDPKIKNGNISIAGTSFTDFVSGWNVIGQ